MCAFVLTKNTENSKKQRYKFQNKKTKKRKQKKKHQNTPKKRQDSWIMSTMEPMININKNFSLMPEYNNVNSNDNRLTKMKQQIKESEKYGKYASKCYDLLTCVISIADLITGFLRYLHILYFIYLFFFCFFIFIFFCVF